MKVNKIFHPFLTGIVSVIGAFYSLLVGYTTKLQIVSSQKDRSTRKQLLDWKDGVIYCCFHSRFFYFSFFGRRKYVVTMISGSKDGDFISKMIYRMGLLSVRGSSSKRGHEAMEEMAQYLEKNYRVLMIPDGPRGPRHLVKPGVIRLAQITGKAILPATFSSTSGIFFRSWDRFLLPTPFGKGVVAIGDPIYVPAKLTNEEFEQKMLELENSMKQILEKADKICKRNPELEQISFKLKKNRLLKLN